MSKPGSNEYECAMCHGVFEKGIPEEEAQAEYQRYFPDEAASGEPRAIICDDCWKIIRKQ